MDNSLRDGVTAIVEYDYKAKEPDELDLVKGAIIINIKRQDIGWWEGTLASNGKTGMFPDNFVRVLSNDEDKVQVVLRDKSTTKHRRCKVVYSYTQNNEDELSLEVGDIIEILGEVEEGWWRGRLADKIGVFPSNFVMPLESSPISTSRKTTISSTKKDNNISSSLHSSREDLVNSSPPESNNYDKDAPILPPKPIREFCRVLFPYKPENDDELYLKVGDIITILSKDLPDKGWWKGELRGKIGVFPDNFVQVEDIRTKDSLNSDKPHSGSSRGFSKKSVSESSPQGSSRIDSFGSRDSLNDILNETGIVSGNVAAQRKSLENKGKVDEEERRTSRRSLEVKTSEIRKNLENVDDKKTPPPVLTKKPIVPIKKQSTVTSVAGNLLSGLKQKVKSVESKLSSSHDNLDGITSSKISSQIPDSLEKGINVEKINDLEFDNIERNCMLSDMRAGRVKAPKRRPPTGATSITGENNNTIHLNGENELTTTESITNDIRSDHNTENEESVLAKPKPREWEKKKAPWMEELKASQAKKTSPNVEPRGVRSGNERQTKSEHFEATSNRNSIEKHEMTSSITNNTSSSNYSLSSSCGQKLKSVELNTSENNKMTNSYEKRIKKDVTITNNMIKSVSSSLTSPKPTAAVISTSSDQIHNMVDDIKIRPTSLSIQNKNISPIGKNILITGKSSSADHAMSTSTSSLLKLNNNISINNNSNMNNSTNNIIHSTTTATTIVNSENIYGRFMDLESRVSKLEEIVELQDKIIDDLIKALKEETDKVKGLKNELEKYAQCVTQV